MTALLTELIAGVDEVGRGPLVGAVVTAAVILDPQRPIAGLTDSKKLTSQKREDLALKIKSCAIAWSLGRAEVAEIDKFNILQATLLAMQRAVMNLNITPDKVWVDGNQCPILSIPCQAIVRGDALIPAISAASIIAKVHRDHEMLELDQLYPEYGYAQHKGYPTVKHLQALQKYGINEHYRRSFSPVKRLLAALTTSQTY